MGVGRSTTGLASLLALVLVACGGGSGGADPAPAPAPSPAPAPAPAPSADRLPATVSISGPTETVLGAAASFTSNVPSNLPGLTSLWSFGDGTSASGTQASHRHSRAAVYRITLTVSDGTGERRSSSRWIRVKEPAPVAGRCTGAAGQGWCWLSPTPWASPLLNGWQAIDATQVFAVGNTGTILRSKDAGRTWVAMPSGSEADLAAIHFLDDRQAWVSALSGQVLFTRDAGNSWVAAGSFPFEGWFAMLLPLADGALLVNDNVRRKSFVTFDEGKSWAAAAINVLGISRPTSERLTLHGIGADGPASGWGRSTDGGRSFARHTGVGSGKTLLSVGESGKGRLWAAVATAVFNADGALVNYVDPDLLRSGDDGATWSLDQKLPANVNGLSVVMRHNGMGLARPMPPWERDLKKVLRTTDGGLTWKAWIDPAGLDAESVVEVRYDTEQVVVTAKDGARLASTDMGVTWEERPRLPSGVSFKRQRNSGFGLNTDQGVIDEAVLQWSDGSNHLTLDGTVRHLMPDVGALWPTFTGAWFSSDNFGVATTAHGESLAPEREAFRDVSLWQTQDGGRTWVPHPQPIAGAGHVQGTSDGLGWLHGTSGLYRTQDGGRNWTLVGNALATRLQLDGRTSDPVVALRFLDRQFGWAVRHAVSVPPRGTSPPSFSTYLSLTEDGGMTWRDIRTGATDSRNYGRAAAMFTPAHAVHVDAQGLVLRSTDGGSSWTVLTASGLPETVPAIGLWVLNATTGWLYSVDRTWRTTDAGRTWTESAPFVPGNWTAMQFVDSQRGWLVGRSGRVMATMDGGQSWVAQPSGASTHFASVFALDAHRVWLTGSDATVLMTTNGGR